MAKHALYMHISREYSAWISPLSRQSICDLLELSSTLPRADEPLLPILVALFKSFEGGSICLHANTDTLYRRLPECLHVRIPELLSQWQQLDQLYPELLTRDADCLCPLVLGDETIGFQGVVHAAHSVLDGLNHLNRQSDQPVLEDAVKVVLSGNNQQLSEDQHKALRLALDNQLSIISGGPGTGKTSIVVNILRCLQPAGQAGRVVLVAPTGRAAQRMTESLHQQASFLSDPSEAEWLRSLQAHTIHSVLRIDRYGRFKHNQDNPLAADTLVLDELSMVDIRLMANLLEATPSECRVIMLGDRDQLPSVEAGVPLTTLLQENEWPIASLSTSFRSVRSILQLALAVNQGLPLDHSLLPAGTPGQMGQQGCLLLDCDPHRPDVLHALLNPWFEMIYPQPMLQKLRQNLDFDHLEVHQQQLDAVFEGLNAGRVLCLTRSGLTGVAGINHVMTNLLREHTSGGSAGYPIGMPVMVTQNDALRELSNGEVGVLMRGTDGDRQVVFRKTDGDISYPLESLAHWEPAFAHTVHKSQGSEYGCVMLILSVPHDHAMLSREVLYTGITRAKNSVLIVGRRSTLQAGASRPIDREGL